MLSENSLTVGIIGKSSITITIFISNAGKRMEKSAVFIVVLARNIIRVNDFSQVTETVVFITIDLLIGCGNGLK